MTRTLYILRVSEGRWFKWAANSINGWVSVKFPWNASMYVEKLAAETEIRNLVGRGISVSLDTVTFTLEKAP